MHRLGEQLEQEITISIESGNVTFSFKTDRTGSNLKEAVKAIGEILSSHDSLLKSVVREGKVQAKPVEPKLVALPDVSLSSLSIPSDVKEKIVSNVRVIPRLKLVMILLRYSKGLTYKNIMTLSKELGKPIIYGWLDTEFQRKEHREFIKSESIPGSQEKLYSLTEPGKRKAEAIIDEIKKK